MRKTRLINQPMASLITLLGHGDLIAVGDAGLPIPWDCERIDLAISPGVPALLEVLRPIADELEVEGLVVAEELLETNDALAQSIAALFPRAAQESLSHEAFKELLPTCKAVIRTGEFTPYANVILRSGVVF